MAPDPLLVLVSGCPGSGKSTLAHRLDGDLMIVETADGYRPDSPTIVSFVEGAR